MLAFYPQIKLFHVGMVLLSGLLFSLRGAALIGGARWPVSLPVRWLSYAIDTALLTAALMLLTILPGAVFANGWLAVKVVLVAVYVGLGICATRRAKTRRQRIFYYLAALAVFATVFSIARTHHPLGWLLWLHS